MWFLSIRWQNCIKVQYTVRHMWVLRKLVNTVLFLSKAIAFLWKLRVSGQLNGDGPADSGVSALHLTLEWLSSKQSTKLGIETGERSTVSHWNELRPQYSMCHLELASAMQITQASKGDYYYFIFFTIVWLNIFCSLRCTKSMSFIYITVKLRQQSIRIHFHVRTQKKS